MHLAVIQSHKRRRRALIEYSVWVMAGIYHPADISLAWRLTCRMIDRVLIDTIYVYYLATFDALV